MNFKNIICKVMAAAWLGANHSCLWYNNQLPGKKSESINHLLVR